MSRRPKSNTCFDGGPFGDVAEPDENGHVLSRRPGLSVPLSGTSLLSDDVRLPKPMEPSEEAGWFAAKNSVEPIFRYPTCKLPCGGHFRQPMADRVRAERRSRTVSSLGQTNIGPEMALHRLGSHYRLNCRAFLGPRSIAGMTGISRVGRKPLRIADPSRHGSGTAFPSRCAGRSGIWL